jgi:hypothetical protein
VIQVFVFHRTVMVQSFKKSHPPGETTGRRPELHMSSVLGEKDMALQMRRERGDLQGHFLRYRVMLSLDIAICMPYQSNRIIYQDFNRLDGFHLQAPLLRYQELCQRNGGFRQEDSRR